MKNKKTKRYFGLRGSSFVAVVLSVTCFYSVSHAQYLTGPVSSALGGAGLGASDEAEQVLINPAALLHGSPFTSALLYQDGYTAENEHDRALGVILADNSEDVLFSGSYAYVNRRRTFENSLSRDEQYHQVTLARFAAKHLGLGATIHFLDTDLDGGDRHKQWDANLGALYNPIPDLGIGLMFYNLASRDKDVPVDLQNLDRVAIGAHYILMEYFRFRLDLSEQLVYNPDHRKRVQAGIESYLGEYLVTRLGYDSDRLSDRNVWSLGLGFNGPRLKIDYFYRKNVDYDEGALHGVDLRLPFW